MYLIKHKLIANDNIDQIKETIHRLHQSKFRQDIILRDKKCIISDADPIECEVAHIIPYSECNSYSISNGILLNACLHKLFDKYLFSINPETSIIHISNINTDLSINMYKNKYINIDSSYKPNLIIHYNKFLKKNSY